MIRRGGDHLLALIEGTLDIARIEGGKLTLEPTPMRFATACSEIARMFELQAAGKGIAFETDDRRRAAAGGARRREAAAADPHQRARQRRQVHAARAASCSAPSYAREMALFEIEDTGPGMSADDLERIFEPFARGSAAGSSGRPAAPASG